MHSSLLNYFMRTMCHTFFSVSLSMPLFSFSESKQDFYSPQHNGMSFKMPKKPTGFHKSNARCYSLSQVNDLKILCFQTLNSPSKFWATASKILATNQILLIEDCQNRQLCICTHFLLADPYMRGAYIHKVCMYI